MSQAEWDMGRSGRKDWQKGGGPRLSPLSPGGCRGAVAGWCGAVVVWGQVRDFVRSDDAWDGVMDDEWESGLVADGRRKGLF